MEFDKSRVYTAVNADELKIGSRVIVADTLAALKMNVERSDMVPAYIIIDILPEDNTHRFIADIRTEWALAYLVSEPAGLKWTDLKAGDVVRNIHSGVEMLITGIDRRDYPQHVKIGGAWTNDRALIDWEKVEE